MGTGTFSSMLLLLVPSVLSVLSATNSCLLIPVRRTTSISNCSIRNSHLTNFSEASADVRNHFKVSWTVSMIKQLCPR